MFTHQQVCAFADVSEKEKHFFLLWNHFMEDNPILTQIQLPRQTRDFVRRHCADIAAHRLEEQLIAHLTSMWYEGVLGRDCLLQCMDLYHGAHASSSAASRRRRKYDSNSS